MLAALMDAVPVRLPAPPFPKGARSVVCGDSHGSLIELIPCGHVLDAEARGGMIHDREMRPRTGSHVLVSTSMPAEVVLAIAEREGLRAVSLDTGLFQFIKVDRGDGSRRASDAAAAAGLPRCLRPSGPPDAGREVSRSGVRARNAGNALA